MKNTTNGHLLTRITRWLLLTGAILTILIILSPAAAAQVLHAQYDHSTPAANSHLPAGKPPQSVEIWFTETIEPAFSQIEVYDQHRQRVDNHDSHGIAKDPYALLVTLHPHLPDGAYTVVFSNVSAEDGHHVQSNFSFVVGAGPLPTNTSALLDSSTAVDENFNAWSVFLRWFNYLGMAGLVGTIIFLLCVWRPVKRIAAQDRIAKRINELNTKLESRASLLLGTSLVILIVGWITFLLYQACINSGLVVWDLWRSQAISETLFHSHIGTFWLIRLFLIGCAVVSYLFWSRQRGAEHSEKESSSWLLWLIALIGLGIMITTSADSHAAANQDAWFLLPADVLHLLSTGCWIGGLLLLVISLPAIWKVLLPGTGERTHFLSLLIPRFSRLALISVIVLLITGSTEAIVELNPLSTLFTTLYGLFLCIKIGIFLLLLCMGAYNLLRLSPSMKRFAGSIDEQNGANSLAAGSLQRSFRRVIGVEVGLMLLVLLAAGALTSLSPPPPPAEAQSTTTTSSGAQSAPTTSSPFVMRGQTSTLTYNLVINPGAVGPNTLAVSLHDPNGKPISDAETVDLRFTTLEMSMGSQDVPLLAVKGTPGQYSATTSALSMSGRWTILLIVQRNGYDDVQIPITYKTP